MIPFVYCCENNKNNNVPEMSQKIMNFNKPTLTQNFVHNDN